MNQNIYDKAVKLLSIRMHTTGELHAKLKDRGFKDEEIREVLRQLEEQKFLDDGRFAEIFVDNLKRYKDWGYYGIKAKLAARKIPSEMGEQALRDYFSIDDELVVAKRLVAKLARQGRKEKDKIMRSLASHGFRTEVIRKVLQ